MEGKQMPLRNRERRRTGTVSRRTLIEWLGRSTVISLSSVLFACTSRQKAITDSGDYFNPGKDIALGDSTAAVASDGAGDAEEQDSPLSGSFPFEPGQGDQGVMKNWGERTVDEQNITDILNKWRLTVDGLVDSPMGFSFSDLIGLNRQDQLTDFHCVEGWSIYDVPWNGVHFSEIMSLVRPKSTATYVTFHTIGDKYNESLPFNISLEPRTILAYGIDGSTLPLKHGFPLRVVIPRLYGYKNAKYIERIELTDSPVKGFWVTAGYPYSGEVPEEELRPGKY